MFLLCKQSLLRVVTCRDGQYRSFEFQPMSREALGALLPQYGYGPEHLVYVSIVEVLHRVEVDDFVVKAWVECYPSVPDFNVIDLRRIVKRFRPDMVHIIGAKEFVDKMLHGKLNIEC